MKFDIKMSEEEILREIREHHIDGIASRVMLEVQTLNVLGSIYEFLKTHDFKAKESFTHRAPLENIRDTLLGCPSLPHKPIEDAFELVDAYLPEMLEEASSPTEQFPYSMFFASNFFFNDVLVNLGLISTRSMPQPHHKSIMIIADPKHSHFGGVVITPKIEDMPSFSVQVSKQAQNLLRDYYGQFAKLNVGDIEDTFIHRIGVSVIDTARSMKTGREADFIRGKSKFLNDADLSYFREVGESKSLFRFKNDKTEIVLKKRRAS